MRTVEHIFSNAYIVVGTMFTGVVMSLESHIPELQVISVLLTILVGLINLYLKIKEQWNKKR
jgi:hypothetical protein